MALQTHKTPPLINRDLIASMDNIQHEIRSLFGATDYPEKNKHLFSIAKDRFTPAVDVCESDKDYDIEMEIPGMSAGDINIELKDNILVVQGEKKTESQKNNKGILWQERTSGTFYRAVPLSQEVNPDKVSAKMKNGVLKIEAQKLPGQARSRKQIKIKD